MPDASPAAGSPVAADPANLLLLTCRLCRYEFRVPAKLAGKKVPCSHCGTQVEVVAAGAKPDPLIGKRLGNCRLTYRLGAGGIGQELKNSMDLLDFSRLFTIIAVILIVVTALDWLSGWLRKRLV